MAQRDAVNLRFHKGVHAIDNLKGIPLQ